MLSHCRLVFLFFFQQLKQTSMTKSNSILLLGEMVMRNQASSELDNRESSSCSYVSSARKSLIYLKGAQIFTALGKTKGGRLILAILNVEEAGVYSESRTEAFQNFLAHSSNYSYLSILFYGLMIPMPSLLVFFVYNIPMQLPSPEVDKNEMYFLTCHIATTVAGFVIAYNIRSFFPPGAKTWFCFNDDHWTHLWELLRSFNLCLWSHIYWIPSSICH